MYWNSISNWWRSNVTFTTFYLLFLGQLVAFILALTSFASSLIAHLLNKAFQFSSITSVTLLDCLTIAWAIILTWFFLSTRYSLWQLFGAALCVMGLGLVLLSDAWIGGGDSSRPLLGDMLVILSTVFFAMSNVGEVDRLYYVAFSVVVIGFIVYSTTEKDPIPAPALENGNSNVQYQIVIDENVASRAKSSDS
ncbi:hypothetical protein Q3G72_007257 [Acer saccharum]|nr:hypothetical protein Q3G72_007257 [Acer saccharum]